MGRRRRREWVPRLAGSRLDSYCRRGGGGSRRGQWQDNVERAAGAGLTLHPDAAAVLRGDALADVEAETHAGVAAIVDVTGAVEPVEDARLVGGRNTDTFVLDLDAGLAVALGD